MNSARQVTKVQWESVTNVLECLCLIKAFATTVSCYSEHLHKFNYLIFAIDCEIPKLCDKADRKCIQCEEGYLEDNGECTGKCGILTVLIDIASYFQCYV